MYKKKFTRVLEICQGQGPLHLSEQRSTAFVLCDELHSHFCLIHVLHPARVVGLTRPASAPRLTDEKWALGYAIRCLCATPTGNL